MTDQQQQRHRGSRSRHRAFDELRGAVIVLMTLDHVRGFIAPAGSDPMNWDSTTVGFFLVRWVTHLCAPAFVLLMGAAAALRARSRPNGSTKFLVTRGLWLILLEATWVSFSWSWDPTQTYLGVLWALGGSMVLLAAVQHLPSRLVFGLGVVLLVALDAVGPQPEPGLLRLMVQPGSLSLFGHSVGYAYPLLPWFAVAAIGWGAVDGLMNTDPRRLRWCGLGLIAAFCVVRSLSGWEANPWEVQNTGAMTLADFLSPSKYPPGVAFVLLTVGAAILVLSGAHRRGGPLSRFVALLGRVPMMFYLVHLPLAHLVGNAYAWIQYGEARVPGTEPVSIPVILGAWLLVVALLAPLSVRWDALKRTRRDLWWLRYL
jgi:uncharacterized membrane protein